MTTRRYLKYDIRTGAPIDDDDVLRDGQRIVVPMNMRDGLSPVQRAVAQDKVVRAVDDPLAVHRPGPRYHVDAAARQFVEQARAEGIREMCDAWRKPVADIAGEVRGQRPGDQCSIDGRPGHLNHRLECIPDRQDSARPVYDAAESERIKAAAYQEMVDELTNAWRKPLP